MRSMTGFGEGAVQQDGIRAEVEIRSGNGRFVEVRLRTPAELAPYEAELRRKVSERVRRGKVDVSISVEAEELASVRIRVNRALAREYLHAADQLREEFQLTGSVGLQELLAVPGLVELERLQREAVGAAGTAGDRLLDAVQRALETALQAHDTARRREGEQLARDLRDHIEEIERLRGEIVAKAPALPVSARDRLTERIRRLLPEQPLDPGRLEQEVAMLADRLDITEELVRLGAHLHAGRELLEAGDEPAGKRLEFLLQEIGRETNTIGSKSGDLEITRCALAIKAAVEKMREQAQNLE